MKMNPITGAIIWTRLINSGGSIPAAVWQLEPLRTTNDIVVSTSYGSGASTDQNVHRIDSSDGSIVWTKFYPMTPNAWGNRCMGVDNAGNIVCPRGPTGGAAITSFQGLDVNGNTTWTQSLPAGSTLRSLIAGPSTALACNNVVFNSTQNTAWKLNSASGGILGAVGLWDTTHDDRAMIACEDSSGNYLGQMYPGTAFTKQYDGTSGAVINTAGHRAGKSRFGPLGYSFVGAGSFAGTNAINATSGTSITPSLFAIDSIVGASLTGLPSDSCSLTTGYSTTLYYFTGGTAFGTSVHFNILCVDATGAFQWCEAFGDQQLLGPSPFAWCCCIGPDGFLYVGGTGVKYN